MLGSVEAALPEIARSWAHSCPFQCLTIVQIEYAPRIAEMPARRREADVVAVGDGHRPSEFVRSCLPSDRPLLPRSSHSRRRNQTAVALTEFNGRLREPVALHQKLANETGQIDETKNPRQITDREVTQGKPIYNAGTQARRGDIFAPPVEALFKQIIRDEFDRLTAAKPRMNSPTSRRWSIRCLGPRSRW